MLCRALVHYRSPSRAGEHAPLAAGAFQITIRWNRRNDELELAGISWLRMFMYMYALTDKLPVEVLTVKGMSRDKHLPDNDLMREFITYHFPRATFKVLKGLPEIEIVKYLHNTNKRPLVVLGAYRRGVVSRWFKASMADELMVELNAR